MSDRWKLYKKCDDFRVQTPRSVQDIIEIKSIAEIPEKGEKSTQ